MVVSEKECSAKNLNILKACQNVCKGEFPLPHNFNLRRQVNFTCANKIEAMYEMLCVKVKVDPRLTVARATLIAISFWETAHLLSHYFRRPLMEQEIFSARYSS